jgi:cytidine deaminase
VLTEDGTMIPGVNVENCSYGLTCCAERVALFAAMAAGQRIFPAMAIASDGGHAPCGACRQVIVELAADAVLYLVDTANGNSFQETSIDELLPHSFKLPPRSER